MTGFKPHSKKQSTLIRTALDDNIKIVAAVTGLQWGKTISGAWWLRTLVHRFTKEGHNFLVTAPTYKILQQSTLPAFTSVFKDLGKYHKYDSCFEIIGGGNIYFRTGTDPDSIVGVTNVFGIWCDEAGKYTKYFWENIRGRAAFRNCPICITTTPYSLNWIYRDIILPVRENLRKDILLINAYSNENPYFSSEVFAERQRTMDHRKFKAMYCGDFEQMQGLVYDCFTDSQNLIPQNNVQFDYTTKYYGGIDWGHVDPFVIVIRAITSDGNHYQIDEFYKTGLVLSEMITVAKTYFNLYNIVRFYCGPDQPGYIESFCREGLPAVKANNDIDLGVSIHYTLIKTRRYKIIKNTSPYTLDELSSYHYPEPQDLLPDQKQKAIKPVGKNDHTLDANRYISVMTHQSLAKNSPKTPVFGRNNGQKSPFLPTVRKNKIILPKYMEL